MTVWFGDLTVKELKERHGLSMTDEEIQELEKYRSSDTTLKENTFHIYAEPESIHLKGREVKEKVVGILSKYSSEFKYKFGVYEDNK